MGTFMIYRTLKMIKAPIAHIQGAYFFIKMKKLNDPTGDRIGSLGEGKSIDILVIGDSSALGVGCKTIQETATGTLVSHLAKEFKVNYTICAYTGFTTAQVYEKVKEIDIKKYNYIIISLGSNDIVNCTPMRIWEKQTYHLFNYIDQNFNPDQLFISAVPPFEKLKTLPNSIKNYLSYESKILNKHYINLSNKKSNYQFIDLGFEFKDNHISEDNFHPSNILYNIQGNRLHQLIYSDLTSKNCKAN